MWHGEFRDPRLVAVYDAEFGWSREDDFFFSIAAETPRARIADVGCGTGRLTLALAAAGHEVTGVDPARASLEAARAKPGAERVRWIEGTSRVLPARAFDLALMTSHVAQFVVDEDDWRTTLADLRRALVPGGRLVFDTRDPRARIWERWTPALTRRVIPVPGSGAVETWTEVGAVQDGTVALTHRYVFAGSAEVAATAEMRFRDEQEVCAAVAAAGLAVEDVFGGWNREPPGHEDGELLVLARRR
jgi:SAM-dependent methyltransferase